MGLWCYPFALIAFVAVLAVTLTAIRFGLLIATFAIPLVGLVVLFVLVYHRQNDDDVLKIASFVGAATGTIMMHFASMAGGIEHFHKD